MDGTGQKWYYVLRGVIALLFGIAAIVWPAIVLEFLVYFFGFFAIIISAFVLIAGAVSGPSGSAKMVDHTPRDSRDSDRHLNAHLTVLLHRDHRLPYRILGTDNRCRRSRRRIHHIGRHGDASLTRAPRYRIVALRREFCSFTRSSAQSPSSGYSGSTPSSSASSEFSTDSPPGAPGGHRYRYKSCVSQ